MRTTFQVVSLSLLFVGAASAGGVGLAWRSADGEPATPADIGIYVENLDRSAAFYSEVFHLRVQSRWDHLTNFAEDGAEQRIDLAGMYMGGDGGLSLEFIERADVSSRQVVQQPINHFALAVEDVDATLARALAAGATLAFPGQRLFTTQAGPMRVIHTQIIGLDGERIQILKRID